MNFKNAFIKIDNEHEWFEIQKILFQNNFQWIASGKNLLPYYENLKYRNIGTNNIGLMFTLHTSDCKNLKTVKQVIRQYKIELMGSNFLNI